MEGIVSIRERLTLMADAGASLNELVTQLDLQDQLKRSDYDSLWLYCWALVRGRRFPQPAGDSWGDYGEVDAG